MQVSGLWRNVNVRFRPIFSQRSQDVRGVELRDKSLLQSLWKRMGQQFGHKPDLQNSRHIHYFVSEADPWWRSCFHAACESPAETAFLDAMIDAFGLVPSRGVLRNQSLHLRLQAQIGNYRADFLANDYLVIEIDGAAYHSSKRARIRDSKRDEFMALAGFSVLRIPAKVVFRRPSEAIDQVKNYLQGESLQKYEWYNRLSTRDEDRLRRSGKPPVKPSTIAFGIGAMFRRVQRGWRK